MQKIKKNTYMLTIISNTTSFTSSISLFSTSCSMFLSSPSTFILPLYSYSEWSNVDAILHSAEHSDCSLCMS